MNGADQIIIAIRGELGIIIIFKTTPYLDPFTIDLLKTGNLSLIDSHLFLVHGKFCIDIHEGMAGKTNGVETLIYGGLYHFFQGVLAVAQDAVGM